MKKFIRVLTIQKSESSNEELKQFLRAAGVRNVTSASSFAEGLESIKSGSSRRKSIKVIFIDGQNELESSNLIIELMADPKMSDIKIIIIHDRDLDILWAFRLGAIGHIVKPFERDEIMKTLNRICG